MGASLLSGRSLAQYNEEELAMPHIHLETTTNVLENKHIERILSALVDQLSEFETIDPSAIKAYYTLRDPYLTGRGAKPGFVHCTIQILTGRPDTLRKLIAESMFQHLEVRFQESLSQGLAGITLELREMDRETYMK